MGATLYKTVLAGATYGELWRLSPSLRRFQLIACCKLLDIPLDLSQGHLYPERFLHLDPADVPDHVWDLWREQIAACEEHGFTRRLLLRIPRAGHQDRENYSAALLSGDGQSVARVLYARDRSSANAVLALSSWRDDGIQLVTSNQRKKMKPRPGLRTVRLPGRPSPVVVERHLRRVQEAGFSIRTIPAADLESVLLRTEQATADEYIRRGLWVPMSEEEAAVFLGQKPPARDDLGEEV